MTRDFKIDVVQSQPTSRNENNNGRPCSMADTMEIQQLLEVSLLEFVPTIIPSDTMWSLEDLYYESEEVALQERDDDEIEVIMNDIVTRQWKFLGMDEIETDKCAPVSSTRKDFFAISTTQQRQARRLRRTVEFSRAPTDFESQVSDHLQTVLEGVITASHCMAGNHLSVEFWMLS